MGFEWDHEHKARENYRRHGVCFPEAEAVLDDPYGIILIDDESNPNEQRFVMLGMGELGRLLVVVYTYRAITFASFQRVPPSHMNERSTRRNYETQLRLQ